MNRRNFILRSGTSLAALSALPVISCSGSKVRKWGIQLFSIPQMVSGDFPGTMKKLSDLGYREIEFFGPYPFSAPATIEAWAPLAGQLGIKNNAFYGLDIADVRAMMNDFNLSAPSVHLDMATLRTQPDEAMKPLSELGVKMAAIPTLMGEEITKGDTFKKLAGEFNEIGKRMKEYGIKLVYHNHGFEHTIRDGINPMETLLELTDPELVCFEMDIFWMQAAGADPIDFLTRYPGRFKLMHVKDAAEKVRFAGDGSSPDQWIPLFTKMADPGSGVFDVSGIIKAAVENGT
ncbi:MAG: sugar phosphate isomerase/epimerase family protein, partial [Cyclobacteriaceae bacterium]